MPANRIVSGTFLKSLADLKFPANTIPAHLINAILFVHATSDDYVQDDFARFISKGDLTSMMKAEKRPSILEADAVIMRAKALAVKLEGVVHKEVALCMVGKLMKDIVVPLLQKDKNKGEGFVIKDCAAAFTKKMCEAAGVESDIGAASPAAPATAAPSAPADTGRTSFSMMMRAMHRALDGARCTIVASLLATSSAARRTSRPA